MSGTSTALVLAGSRGPGDPLAAYAGVSHKAMIEVDGRPMLARVIDALAAAGLQRIVVVIERPDLVESLREAGALPASVVVETLPAQAGPSASVQAGLRALGAPLLVTTADHALLQPDWVRYFLAHAPEDAAVAAGLARAEVVTAAAPDTKRTFLRFADGAWSGCNLFHLSGPGAERIVALWREAEALRKQPLKLFGKLGFWTALRFAAGALPLQAALDRLSRIAGARAAVVELPFGRAAIDVDKPADLELVRRLLREDAGLSRA